MEVLFGYFSLRFWMTHPLGSPTLLGLSHELYETRYAAFGVKFLTRLLRVTCPCQLVQRSFSLYCSSKELTIFRVQASRV